MCSVIILFLNLLGFAGFKMVCILVKPLVTWSNENEMDKMAIQLFQQITLY